MRGKSMTVPVTIVSGFLGSGKTTLLNRILADTSERLVVIVNDFAQINIDARLVESASPDRIALSNGCVCCTLRDDLLSQAIGLAEASPRPDRIVIETSGVSDPYGVMEAFYAPEAEGLVSVESSVCLIDAEAFPALDFSSGELALSQAAVSDIVLLNKCDLADDPQVDGVEATLRGALPAMRILRTSHARVPVAVLFGDGSLRPPKIEGAEHSRHVASNYASYSWCSSAPISLAAFEDMVRGLPTNVLRAKGVLAFADAPAERAVFHLVGKRASLAFEPGSVDESALVFIGLNGAFDPEEIAALTATLRAPAMPAHRPLQAAGRSA
jgi:G3E family GTPase